METAILLVALGTLAGKVVGFIKYLVNKDKNGYITQAAVWLAGLVVVFLGSNASAFEEVVVPGMGVPLGLLSWADVVLVGLSLSSFISFGYDFKKAFDGSDSAKEPPLVK